MWRWRQRCQDSLIDSRYINDRRLLMLTIHARWHSFGRSFRIFREIFLPGEPFDHQFLLESHTYRNHNWDSRDRRNMFPNHNLFGLKLLIYTELNFEQIKSCFLRCTKISGDNRHMNDQMNLVRYPCIFLLTKHYTLCKNDLLKLLFNGSKINKSSELVPPGLFEELFGSNFFSLSLNMYSHPDLQSQQRKLVAKSKSS